MKGKPGGSDLESNAQLLFDIHMIYHNAWRRISAGKTRKTILRKDNHMMRNFDKFKQKVSPEAAKMWLGEMAN